jgi:RimJ/RimL family protein N-acetyltransferase
MNTSIVVPDSARLRFRLMDTTDAPLWFKLDQDPEVMRFLNDGQPTTWEEIEQYFIPRVVGFTNVALGHGLWEVADKHTSTYLGWMLARQYGITTSYHEPDNLELGWRLKRECWGKGIATEAANAVMLAVVKNDPSLRVVSAIASAENIASTTVMKKLGMRFVDERVHETPLRNFDCSYYEMPREAAES